MGNANERPHLAEPHLYWLSARMMHAGSSGWGIPRSYRSKPMAMSWYYGAVRGISTPQGAMLAFIMALRLDRDVLSHEEGHVSITVKTLSRELRIQGRHSHTWCIGHLKMVLDAVPTSMPADPVTADCVFSRYRALHAARRRRRHHMPVGICVPRGHQRYTL